MFCPECGNQNPDTAKFCMKCGYNCSQPTNTIASEQVSPEIVTPSTTVSQPQISPPHQNSVPENTKKSNPVVLALLLLLIFGMIAYLGVQFSSHPELLSSFTNTSYKPQSFGNSTGTSSQGSQAQRQSVVSQAFTVDAGQMRYFKFTIPSSSGTGTVTGNFTASGGNNDIDVVITNETGLTNIKNKNAPKVFYESGKVTTDDINVNLSAGTYYVVFSNAPALLTPKAINADTSVTY